LLSGDRLRAGGINGRKPHRIHTLSAKAFMPLAAGIHSPIAGLSLTADWEHLLALPICALQMAPPDKTHIFHTSLARPVYSSLKTGVGSKHLSPLCAR
jgi:hypothetical protein